jgi:poly-beta-1,6-N-acetyl-D-glucosamine N-deacetylase
MRRRRRAAHRDSTSGSLARSRTRLVTIGFVVLVAGYLAVPGLWQWARAAEYARYESANIVEQVETPVPTVDAALVEQLRNAPSSTQGAPVIVTYHDIGYSADRYTVSPEAFAEQMQVLKDAGWTTLTAAQLERWLQGEPVPAHSVMITFDDGARGVWKYADPILKRNGQHASAYIITGFVGTHRPYYMTWEELAALQSSGRWDLEAHTHLGHVQVPTDASGRQAPFLTSLQYLSDQRRVETADEFRARIVNDLVECKRQFAIHNLPTPGFFAYPFSAHGDEPGGTGILTSVIKSLFHAAMLDQPGGIATTTSDNMAQGNIARMDTTQDVSLQTWVERVEGASPLDPLASQPLSDPGGWTDSNQQAASVTIDGDRLLLDPGPGGQESRQYARYRSTMWNSYTVSVDVGGFTASGDGTTTAIAVLAGDSRHQVLLSVSSGFYQVNVGYLSDEPFASAELPDAASHHVEMRVTAQAVTITIDESTVVDVPLAVTEVRTAAGGISISGHREFDTSPVPEIRGLVIR